MEQVHTHPAITTANRSRENVSRAPRTTGALCTSDDLGEDCSFGNNDGTTTILLDCEQDGLSTLTVIASSVPR